MIKSTDVNMADFLREIDNSVEQSRAVFNQWDALHNPITPEMWDAIQLKVNPKDDNLCSACVPFVNFDFLKSLQIIIKKRLPVGPIPVSFV